MACVTVRVVCITGKSRQCGYTYVRPGAAAGPRSDGAGCLYTFFAMRSLSGPAQAVKTKKEEKNAEQWDVAQSETHGVYLL